MKTLSDVWDPEAGKKVLGRLRSVRNNAETFFEDLPDQGRALLNFLIFSPISLEKIVRDPPLLEWLSHSDVANRRPAPRWRAHDDLSFRQLRSWKSQEMLRVAFREVTGLADFFETASDITSIAERCVLEVYQTCYNYLTGKWGAPKTGFGILAMGKFGGGELNYSSDIDLIFIYGDDGYLNPRFTYHEFFSRLAERITTVFSAPGDPLFRIDLRLRPEGALGPIVRSLASIENYYAGYGETWERMALVKARGIAGDQELLYEFNQHLQPFIFPTAVSTDLLEEIALIKSRIEKDVLRPSELHRNVKLGYGGIREVEFVVQTLQVLHGAKHPFLQERSTLKTLTALERVRIFPDTDLAQLRDSYIFLRAVEHRLQIQHEQQTHTLPIHTNGLFLIARSLAFPTVESFSAEFSTFTQSVRTIFDKFFRSRVETPALSPVSSVGFTPNADAKKTLAALRDGPADVHVAPRTKRLYSQLEPQLLEWCRRLADPDAVISRFARFVDKYGIRGLLFETLLANPKLLELLVRLFDASAAASDIVIRRPQLIEEIARGKSLGRASSREEFLQGLLKNPIPEFLDRMRLFRREEGVRILLADILGFSSQSALQKEMTLLAEACLDFCASMLEAGSELTIVALGKFGGHELLYGADLDLVLIGTDQSVGGRLIQSMTSMRAEGRVFPIDCRLRPDGEKGILVNSLDGYRTYLEDRAQLWEIQALTKVRVVRGPETAAVENLIREVWLRRGAETDLKQQVFRMYRRIVKERSKGESMLNFKTGDGGLIAIEFLLQYLQMKYQIREPNTLAAISLLDSALSPGEKDTLRESYSFLRRVESTLRRMNDTSVSVLPSTDLEQTQLAIRLEFPSKQAFLDDYGAKRQAVATLVDAHLGDS